MSTTATTISKKSIEQPDEVREFDKGKIELVTLGDVTFGRAVFQPGWRWSECVKPLMGTDSCEFAHRTYIAAGSLHVRMDDGTELDAGTGDVVVIPPGHDAWVTSDEACVMLDFPEDDIDFGKAPS